LVVTPAFFGYEKDIVAEFERQGFATTLLDERPSNSAFVRAIARARKSLIGPKIDAYYRDWASKLHDVRLDLVLVIKAEVVPRWFLEILRTTNPNARFVFYTFDAIANASNCMDVIDLFDRKVTFDRADAAEHPGFEYLPLFYPSEFRPLEGDEAERSRRYELTFVGTLHSDRYRFVTTLSAGVSRAKNFFYVQARWYFALVKYVTREHANVRWSDVSFTPMTRAETAEAFRNSVAVLDMQRNGQTGLSMRTFEVLASGAMLVTTNSAITHESFYDPARIIVVSSTPTSEDRRRVRRLIESARPAGSLDGVEQHSIENWVSRLASAKDLSRVDRTSR